MTIYRTPIVYKEITPGATGHDILDLEPPGPGEEEERLDPAALDFTSLVSVEDDNCLEVSVIDGKLYVTCNSDCTFDMATIISTESGNHVRLSIVDGKLFVGDCEGVNVAELVSSDTDNGLGFGSDGKLWFDGTEDCDINIANLLSTEAGNDIHLSIEDGKLYGRFSGECNIDLVELISPEPDNRLVIAPDGKIYLPPYDCQFDLADWVSGNQWNRLRLDTGDGKLLVLSEEQVSTSRANNALKAHLAGDHRLYVDPAELIHTGADSGVKTETDGKINVDWDRLKQELLVGIFSSMRIVTGGTLPAGGQWAYIAFSRHTDGDVEGDWFMQDIKEAGVKPGGSVIVADAEEIKMVVWQVAS